jgi:hypothetical protein
MKMQMPKKEKGLRVPEINKEFINQRTWTEVFTEIRDREKIPQIVDAQTFIQAANLISL